MGIRDQRVSSYIDNELRKQLGAFAEKYRMNESQAIRFLMETGLEADQKSSALPMTA